MSKTLEELQAELDAELAAKKPARTSAPPDQTTKVDVPRSPPRAKGAGGDERKPKKTRGLLDFILMCALGYGVYAMTPIGAMGEAAVRYALGQKESPSFFATFRGRETDVQVKAPDIKSGLLASKAVPKSVAAAASGTGVDAELLVTLLSTNGKCDSSGCTLKAPRYLDIILQQELGEVVTVAQVANGLRKAAHDLGVSPKGVGGELAVEALYVGLVPVRLALEQAKATGIQNAEDVEAHAEFYAPSIRRGPLQKALSVLALHRLRTLAWPAKGKWRISSPFGYRTHPVLGTKKFHNGTDLAVPTGTPLLAVNRGVVSRARRDSICGNYVKLNYGFGIESTYCHMSKIGVEKGARLKREEKVGLSGATGRVTGPHLHYILRVNGDPVDAEMYGASPTRKKATDGEDPLGKIEAAAANDVEDKPKATGKTAKKSAKKSGKKKPKAGRSKKKNADKAAATPKKNDDGAPSDDPAPADVHDAGGGTDGEEAVADDEDRPEPTPAMPVPEGEESVDIEAVDDASDNPPPPPPAADDGKAEGDAHSSETKAQADNAADKPGEKPADKKKDGK